MKISYHGHSCVMIEFDEGTRIIIDPFITGNPLSDLNPNDVQVDYILLTHAHNDHVGDTELIANNNDALIIGIVELCDYYEQKGFRVHGLNIGGQYPFDFGVVKMVNAIHSSSLYVDGENIAMGNAAGFIIKSEGKIIYHAGDTALFSDMRIYAEEGRIDIAFLPIGDNYTMGPLDAIKACHYLQPRKMVPIHYNTFELIKQDTKILSDRLPKILRIMEVSDVWEL